MWCTVGYETGALWDLWDWFISPSTHTVIWWHRVAPWPLYIPHSNPHTWQTLSGLHSTTSSFWIRVDSQTIPRSSETINQHYNDVIIGAIVSQITSLTIVYSIVYSDADKKKTSKLRVTGLCEGNSPGTGEFPAQMASYAENVSIWWRHHDLATFDQPLLLSHIFGIRGSPNRRHYLDQWWPSSATYICDATRVKSFVFWFKFYWSLF